MRQPSCFKRKGIKGLRVKSPDTPNPKTVALTDDELEAIDEDLEPGDVRRVAGKLGRTPVVDIGKTANGRPIGK